MLSPNLFIASNLTLPSIVSQSNITPDNAHSENQIIPIGLWDWSNLSSRRQIAYLVVLILFSATLLSLIAALLSIVFFGVNILTDPDALSRVEDPNVLSAMKFLQITQHIGLFIIPSILFSYLVSGNGGKYLKLTKRALPMTYVFAALIMFLAFPVINWMVMVNEAMVLPEFLAGMEEWMKQMEGDLAVVTEKLLQMNSYSDLAVNFLMIAIIPAIGEEMLFRGVIQRVLGKMTGSTHAGVWIAAILFSAMHMQFYGFLPRMMLGVLFGYLFVWSGSLLVPMLCHLINNGATVIVVYIEGVETLSEQEGSFGTSVEESFYTLGCALVIAGLLFMIRKRERAVGHHPT